MGLHEGKQLIVCRKNKIICHEENFAEDIRNCEEAFVTGTFAGIIPVSRIENRNLKSINSNSLVNKIRILYNNHIQENISLT